MKKTVIAPLVGVALLLTTGCGPSVDNAIKPATALIAINQAKSTLDKVDNIRTSLDGDVKTSLDKAASHLNNAIKELEKLAGENIKQPLESLGYDAQNLARQLADASTRVDLLLDRQQK